MGHTLADCARVIIEPRRYPVDPLQLLSLIHISEPTRQADRWGSNSWATRLPTARGSSSSPVAIPLIHCSSSEEMAVTTTEKLDSSASSPSIVPSAEQPVRGAPPVVSRTAHQGGLIVSDRGEHEDEVWLGDTRVLQRLLCGLTTRDVRIVMSTRADARFGSHGRTPPTRHHEYPSLEELSGISEGRRFSP